MVRLWANNGINMGMAPPAVPPAAPSVLSESALPSSFWDNLALENALVKTDASFGGMWSSAK